MIHDLCCSSLPTSSVHSSSLQRRDQTQATSHNNHKGACSKIPRKLIEMLWTKQSFYFIWKETVELPSKVSQKLTWKVEGEIYLYSKRQQAAKAKHIKNQFLTGLGSYPPGKALLLDQYAKSLHPSTREPVRKTKKSWQQLHSFQSSLFFFLATRPQ